MPNFLDVRIAFLPIELARLSATNNGVKLLRQVQLTSAQVPNLKPSGCMKDLPVLELAQSSRIEEERYLVKHFCEVQLTSAFL